MKSITLPPGQTPGADAPLPASARQALSSLTIAILLASLGTSIANVGLPSLALAFHAPFQQVQWVVLAYLLAITTLVVSVGRLGDIVGRRRLMLAGISVFTVASWLCALAPTLGMLIAARVLQGLGAATMMALGMAMVGEVVPKARTGSAMGWLGTMSAVGTALGPTLGGVLIAGCGWTGLFEVLVPLGLVALLLAWRTLPADRPAPTRDRAGFDIPGTLVLALTLAAYALAMTLGRGSFGLVNMALLAGAALGGGLFAFVESRAASPLVRLALFRDPVLSAGFAMSALVTTVVMATLVVGPFYLAGALALDAAQVGLVMSSGPAVAALSGAPAGRLVDRFGAYRMGVGGLLAMAIGAATLPWLAGWWGVAGYVGPLMLVTAGYALFQAANNTAVMVDVAPERRGVVSGLLNLSRNLGLITGASLMGLLFALGATTGDIAASGPTSAVAGLQITFGVATGLIMLALMLAYLGRTRVAARAGQRSPGKATAP